MPRPRRRAGGGLLLLLAALLLATPATSDPKGFDPRPVLWSAEPILNGEVVASCGGTSPLKNTCPADIGPDKCRRGCAPNVLAGTAYTGTVTALVWGKGSQGDDRFLSWTCQYLAGSQTRVLGFGTSECWWSTNAESFCLPECGYYLWPPFRLEGRSQPFQGAGPAGSWSVRVET